MTEGGVHEFFAGSRMQQLEDFGNQDGAMRASGRFPCFEDFGEGEGIVALFLVFEIEMTRIFAGITRTPWMREIGHEKRLFFFPGIESVAEAVAEEVKGEQGERHKEGGENEEPPVGFHRVDRLRTFGEEGAPTGLGCLDAEAKEGEKRFVENDGRDGKGDVNQDHTEEIRQDVAGGDAEWGLAESPGGEDEGLGLDREHLAPNDAGHGEPFDCAEGEDEDEDFRVADKVIELEMYKGFLEPGIESAHGNKNKNEARDGVKDIDEAHHQGVGFATFEAGIKSVTGSNKEGNKRTADAHGERDAGSCESVIKHVASIEVGAKRVFPGWRRKLHIARAAVGFWKDKSAKNGGENDEAKNQT